MKKFLTLLVCVITFAVALTGHAEAITNRQVVTLTAPAKDSLMVRGSKDIAIKENPKDSQELPTCIGDMQQIDISEVPKSKTKNLGNGYYLESLNMPDTGMVITRLRGNGKMIIFVGEYYKDPFEGKFCPMDWLFTASYARMYLYEDLIYVEGAIEGESPDVYPEADELYYVPEGRDPLVHIRYETVMHDGEEQNVTVIIPNPIYELGNVEIDLEYAISSTKTFLAGQGVNRVYFCAPNGIGGLVRYYQYNDQIYTVIHLLSNGQKIIVNDVMLFDPGYFCMYNMSGDITIYYMSDYNYFYVHAGNLTEVDEEISPYLEGCYQIENNVVRIMEDPTLPNVSLHVFNDGTKGNYDIPMVISEHVTAKKHKN